MISIFYLLFLLNKERTKLEYFSFPLLFLAIFNSNHFIPFGSDFAEMNRFIVIVLFICF